MQSARKDLTHVSAIYIVTLGVDSALRSPFPVYFPYYSAYKLFGTVSEDPNDFLAQCVALYHGGACRCPL
jgi:hypothetical protein